MSTARISIMLIATVGAFAGAAAATGFGVNGHIPSAGSADRMVAAGIEWVRIDFLWSFVEREPDRYDWSIYDALLDRLEDRDLRILAGLGATPAWATAGDPIAGVPDDPEQWAEFCYLAALRYAGRVNAWGLWNEPNLDHFWAGSRDQYLNEILIPGARSIRFADPMALVVGPDLAHVGSADWDDWLAESIIAAGDLLDVVTHHVYPNWGRAETVTEDLQYGGPLPISPPAVRDVLRDAGWWRRPFWLTETGVQSSEYGPTTQADFVRSLLRQWYGLDRRSRSWVDRIFFYEMHDGPAPSRYTWGLTHGPPDYEPKPAYWSYEQFIREAYVMDAELVEATVPRFLKPGEEVIAKLVFRNTGTLEWADYRYVFLDVATVRDDWNIEVEELQPGDLVEPGQTRAFEVRLRAPDTIGTATVVNDLIVARLDRENEAPFGDMLRRSVAVSLLAPPTIAGPVGSPWVSPGRPARLSVTGGGAGPLAFRWYRNGVQLTDDEVHSGTGSATLTVAPTTQEPSDGWYFCELTNEVGSVVSAPLLLSTGLPPPRSGDDRVRPGAPAAPATLPAGGSAAASVD